MSPICCGCGEPTDHYFILWRKGTKDKHPGRQGGFKLRDPKLVCPKCVDKFPDHEPISEYKD